MVVEMLRKYAYKVMKIIALGAFLLLGSGCVTTSKFSSRSAESAFEAATEKYARYVRWGFFEEAADFSRARDASHILLNLNDTAEYRVSDYKILSRFLADNGFEGRVAVSVEYYHVDSGILHSLHIAQSWWYDHVQQRWYTSNALPEFANTVSDK